LLRAAVGRSGPVAPDRSTGDRWLAVAQRERLVPLLYVLVDTVPTDLSERQREQLHDAQVSAMWRCVRLEHRLLLAVGVLAEHGIRSAVLKGGATAHLDYPGPSWRETGDVDVLIDAEHRERAVELLRANGWERGYALNTGHEAYSHEVPLLRDGLELDLHQRVAPKALGARIPARALLDNAVPFVIADTTMFALHEIDRVIHSTVHAVASRGASRRLSSFADVLVGTYGRPHLAHRVLARAEEWRVRPLVERGVHDAYSAAQLEVPSPWTDAMRRPIRHRDHLLDRAYLGEHRRPIAQEVAFLRLLSGRGNRLRYLRGYFTTSPEYVARYGRSGAVAQARYVLAKLRSHT
jgi:hypothetical protein